MNKSSAIPGSWTKTKQKQNKNKQQQTTTNCALRAKGAPSPARGPDRGEALDLREGLPAS